MKIPNWFKTAGGKRIDVYIVDSLPSGNYGEFSDAENSITLAKTIKVYGKVIILSEEDIYRTYLHELVHCFNYYYNCECDESLAQTFSNLMYEYLKTKDGDLQISST